MDQLPGLVQFVLQVVRLLGMHGQIACQLLLLGIEVLGKNVDLGLHLFVEADLRLLLLFDVLVQFLDPLLLFLHIVYHQLLASFELCCQIITVLFFLVERASSLVVTLLHGELFLLHIIDLDAQFLPRRLELLDLLFLALNLGLESLLFLILLLAISLVSLNESHFSIKLPPKTLDLLFLLALKVFNLPFKVLFSFLFG